MEGLGLTDRCERLTEIFYFSQCVFQCEKNKKNATAKKAASALSWSVSPYVVHSTVHTYKYSKYSNSNSLSRYRYIYGPVDCDLGERYVIGIYETSRHPNGRKMNTKKIKYNYI